MNEIKPWKCPSGHVLGQVRRNGSGIRQLLLYREAVNDAGTDPVEVDVMAVVEGYTADVRCSVCGSMRTWFTSQEAMEKLIKQVGKMRSATEAHGS